MEREFSSTPNNDDTVSAVAASFSGEDKSLRPSSCHYCEAELNPFYYFCIRCGLPYTPPDNVLPPAQAPYINDGMRIKSKAPHASALFWSYFSVLVITSVIAMISDAREDSVLLLVFNSVLLALVTLVFSIIHWTCLKVQFKKIGFDVKESWVGLAALLPLFIFAVAYFKFIELIAPVALYRSSLPDFGLSFEGLVLLACLYPAITEEIGFRGLLQHWLSNALGPKRGLVLTSALFAGIHFSVISFPLLFLVGLLLGWTKQRTGSLYPSMLIHFSYNLAMIIFISETASQ